LKAEIFNLQKWILSTDAELIVRVLKKSLLKANFEIINFTEHHFSPQGYTALWLIAESHLALHTFPEENKSYIELSSCNKEKNQTFKELIELGFSNFLMK